MKIILAQPRGFCAGVDRAIDIVEEALKIYGPPVYVKHEIVHNKRVVEDLKEKHFDVDDAYVKQVIHLVKERAVFIADLWEQGNFFFERPSSYDEKAAKKAWKEETAEIMQNVKNVIAEVEDFNQENLQEKVKGWITNEGIGFGKVMQPLRLSLVGEMKGPDLFHIMTSVGKEETLKRIDFAIEKLK